MDPAGIATSPQPRPADRPHPRLVVAGLVGLLEFTDATSASQMVLTRCSWSVAAVLAPTVVAGVPFSAGPAEATVRSIDLDASAVVETRERVVANLERFSVPGAALALVVDGEVAWAEGFGLADTASGGSVQPDTRFQAGSLSKSVLAWTVLQLAAEGTIDLDVPVETQIIDGWSLPETPYDTAGVTSRRLLAHTSGLPFAIDGTGSGTRPDPLAQPWVAGGLVAVRQGSRRS